MALAIPIIAWLVWANRSKRLIRDEFIEKLTQAGGMQETAAIFLKEISTPAGIILMTTLVGAMLYLFVTAVRSPRR